MASSSSSILCSKKPHILVRRITTTPPRPTISTTFTFITTSVTTSSSTTTSSTTTTTSRSSRVAGVMTKGLVTNNKTTTTSSSFINRGERISVWWRDGWRLISCADFGLGAQCAKRRNLSQKPSFSSSSSSSSSPSAPPSRSSSDMVSDNKEEDRDNNEHHRSFSNHQQSTKLLTLPTILTLGRVAAIPLLITTFYGNSWWATSLTTSIFVVAAITDWLDGYLARKMRLGTPFGAFLDPVADKLMVAATLVLLCTRPLELSGFGEISWLLPIPSIAIIGREITMSAVREWAASQNGKVLEAVAVNNLGKWKTATQMIALTILLATRDSSIVGSHILVPSGVALLYISAGLALWSLAVYMRKIWTVLLKL